MRAKQGGTHVHCPSCGTTQVCKAINPSAIAYQSGQHWGRTDHMDINWFRRGRICLKCGHEFLTAELDEGFVSELVELRDALAEIKMHAESYQRESAAATVSLTKLTKSLRVLRALKVYKSA